MHNSIQSLTQLRLATAVRCLVIFGLCLCSCASEEQAQPEQSASAEVEQAADAPHHPVDAEAAEVEQSALHKADPLGNYGAGIVLQKSTAIAAILNNPEPYEGKIVQVQGEVVEVCAKRGCWMELASEDASQRLRIKVQDGEIVFPLSAKGNTAVVEGIVEKLEFDEEQHRAWKAHEAEERGETFDPASVSGPLAIWRIQGLGARIEG